MEKKRDSMDCKDEETQRESGNEAGSEVRREQPAAVFLVIT